MATQIAMTETEKNVLRIWMRQVKLNPQSPQVFPPEFYARAEGKLISKLQGSEYIEEYNQISEEVHADL